MYTYQDEGKLLKKLLAIFSLRPTYAQISSIQFTNRVTMGLSNIGELARTTFVNIPIINLKIPNAIEMGSVVNMPARQIHLNQALTQPDCFVENRMIVPRNKSIIYSKDVMFFYVPRRYNNVNVANLDLRLRQKYIALPASFLANSSSLNETKLNFEDTISIGKDKFCLRSVVVVQKPPIACHVSTGCNTIVVDNHVSGNRMSRLYLYYNPQAANILYRNQAGEYVRNPPITYIPEVSYRPNEMGFRNEVWVHGTVFFYATQNTAVPC